MPATTYNASTGVRVPVDRVHKGPGQAGNKSALTYRCDIGVPGYTGFIPQTAAIPLQVKGSTKYIGRTIDGSRKEIASVCPPDYHTTSWYQKQFQAAPAAYQRPSKDSGGYWIAKGVEGCGRAFSGNTTYQCELQHGGPTAQQQLASTVGLRSTVSCYDGARRGASSGSIKSLPASVRQPLGFRTMYSSMHGEQIELQQAYAVALPAAAVSSFGARPSTATCASSAVRAPQHVQSRTVLMAHAPKEDVGSHTIDFGAYGDDPLSRTVGAATDMSQAATTHDLAAGTARSTKQLPGYTGFIPESDHNALACHEASGVQQPRQDGRAATMLFTLDQYSRQRVPLYTGHRPTALSNLSVQEPAHGPTTQTTQGYANFRATQRPHTVDNSKFLDSRKGTMGFFNAGSSLFASDNGLAEAQRFFQSKRGRRAGR
ncbi:hypothetical protein ABBQ32_008236 [Trebouxia sp. C0010 RCD-2024]